MHHLDYPVTLLFILVTDIYECRMSRNLYEAMESQNVHNSIAAGWKFVIKTCIIRDIKR